MSDERIKKLGGKRVSLPWPLYLRPELLHLLADIEDPEEESTVLDTERWMDAAVAMIRRLQQDHRELVEALIGFGRHEPTCPQAHIGGGRPTANGGYEFSVRGKWYLREDIPACTCGLEALIAKHKGGQGE